MSRRSGRPPDALRPVSITPNYLDFAEGSALVTWGRTRVLCAASVLEQVPAFKQGTGEGWVTAEYAMLPRSTGTRNVRESSRGKISGRTQEIQRLIGRSMRAVVDLALLGERTIWIDCDVIQADGGTRTASITGSFVALWDACSYLLDKKMIKEMPILDFVAATSVGIVDGQRMLDLCYAEDSSADVDMNIVMTGRGRFVEIQGTAEALPFTREEVNELIELASKGIQQLIALQRKMLLNNEDTAELTRK